MGFPIYWVKGSSLPLKLLSCQVFITYLQCNKIIGSVPLSGDYGIMRSLPFIRKNLQGGIAPAYFTLHAATGILAVAAHVLYYDVLGWALCVISLICFAYLLVFSVAKSIPGWAKLKEQLVSYEEGPMLQGAVVVTCITAQLCLLYKVFMSWVPWIYVAAFILWAILFYTFLLGVLNRQIKPGIREGFYGGWFLLVISTEFLSCVAAQLAMAGYWPVRVSFLGLVLFLIGIGLYGYLSVIALIKWVFERRVEALEASWMLTGAAASIVLAGSRLLALPMLEDKRMVLDVYIALAWGMASFWLPVLLALLIKYHTHNRRLPQPFEFWSMVFSLGVYVTGTYNYAVMMDRQYLYIFSVIFFWFALFMWLVGIAEWLATSSKRRQNK